MNLFFSFFTLIAILFVISLIFMFVLCIFMLRFLCNIFLFLLYREPALLNISVSRSVIVRSHMAE